MPLDDGSFALQLRVQLNDARALRGGSGAEASELRELVLLVDGSQSMRRRWGAVVDLVQRLTAVAPGRVKVVLVGEQTAEVPTVDPEHLLRGLHAAEVGLHTSWEELRQAAAAEGCTGDAAPTAGRRCLLVTDPQVDELPPAEERTLPALFLADADELAYFGERLGRDAVTYQPGIDPRGKLLAFADTQVLPVLELGSLDQAGGTLVAVGPAARPVAEGGLLRLFGRTASEQPLRVAFTIDGRPHETTVPVEVLPAAGDSGRAVRHGYYAALLGDWMAAYRRSQEPELRQRIVDTSVREGIPTELTGLQVADDAPGGMAPTATAGPLLRRLGALLLALGLALGWWSRRPS